MAISVALIADEAAIMPAFHSFNLPVRAIPINLGPNLALLAICVQVVVTALGGRLCYRVTPFPQTEGCASACCHDEAPADGERPELKIELEIASLTPPAPIEPDCCIEQASDYLTKPTVSSDLKFAATLAAAALPAFLTETTPRDLCRPSVIASFGQAAQPPPSMPVIRTTILLI